MKKKIYIEGMTCQHCVMHVKKALEDNGCNEVDINLEKGYAEVVDENNLSDDMIRNIIDEAGYDLIKIDRVLS
jgi:Cu2+-exporting ATPase